MVHLFLVSFKAKTHFFLVCVSSLSEICHLFFMKYSLPLPSSLEKKRERERKPPITTQSLHSSWSAVAGQRCHFRSWKLTGVPQNGLQLTHPTIYFQEPTMGARPRVTSCSNLSKVELWGQLLQIITSTEITSYQKTTRFGVFKNEAH